MKRDMDLWRLMLRRYEGEQPEPDLSKYTTEQILYHDQLMQEAGHILAEFIKNEHGDVVTSIVERLTNAGHDFLEASRNDTVWAKFKKATLKVGGGVSIPVAIELLKAYAKTELGISP